jgi:hypothetical protein
MEPFFARNLPRYPVVAPAVSPETILRWKNRTRITSG